MRDWFLMLAAMAAGLSPNGASAQAVLPPEPCTCILPAVLPGRTVGSVQAVTGDVLMSMPDGYGPVRPGAAIVNGSRIVVGAEGSATLGFGASCSIVAPSTAVVVVAPQPRATCVSMQTPRILPGARTGAGSGAGAGAAAVAPAVASAGVVPMAFATFGLAALGLGGLVAVEFGHDEPVSR